ncbi:GDSL-type esterase/lipase family protein [uncultured Amnibacterium sp.]|uniref:GDSL-type esterase/lipase family protein n=1 Tax=uncultured Amnibacterium sp. TaxID=1631851 RepID=UPI0035CB29D1
MRRSVRTAAVAAALLLACAGCTATPDSAPPVAPTGGPTTTAVPTPAPTGPPSTVAVLGDSLSRGFNACAHYGDCPSVSWAGGTDPRIGSIATRLGAITDGPVAVHSFARSGATVDDLRRQVASAVAVHPDLITLLIGANDVCRATLGEMTPTAGYAAAVTSALQQISLYAPDAVVLVASVPDVTALVAVAGTDPTARFLWSRAGGCATALADPESTTFDSVERRRAVAARITEYDTVLAGACIAVARCVYDGGALNADRFTLPQLSALDRFHPSVRGLQALALLEWQALSADPRAVPLFERG